MRFAARAVGAAFALASVAAPVAPVTAATLEAPTDDPVAVAALQRSTSTPVAYEGTRVVTSWTGTQSTSVVFPVARGVTDPTAGTATSPGAASMLREPGAAMASLIRVYDLSTAGESEVFGRRATLVVASRDGRERARWWLDRQTGLVLRQEIYDTRHHLRRLSALRDLTVLSTTTGSAVPEPRSSTSTSTDRSATVPTSEFEGPSPWPDVMTTADLESWRAEGRPCPSTLATDFDLVDARRSSNGSGAVLHLTYTDGIDDASLFVQQGRLGDQGPVGYAASDWQGVPVLTSSSGAQQQVVWQGGDDVFTLVTSAPQDSARQMVAALPHESGDGMRAAMARFARSVGAFAAAAGASMAAWGSGE